MEVFCIIVVVALVNIYISNNNKNYYLDIFFSYSLSLNLTKNTKKEREFFVRSLYFPTNFILMKGI